MLSWVEKLQVNLHTIADLIAMLRTRYNAAEAQRYLLWYAERNPEVIDEICRLGFVPAIHNAIVSRMSQMWAGNDGRAERILNEIADCLAQDGNDESVQTAGSNLQAALQRRKRARELKSLGYDVEERQRQSELACRAS